MNDSTFIYYLIIWLRIKTYTVPESTFTFNKDNSCITGELLAIAPSGICPPKDNDAVPVVPFGTIIPPTPKLDPVKVVVPVPQTID